MNEFIKILSDLGVVAFYGLLFGCGAHLLSGLFGPRQADVTARVAELNEEAPEEFEGQEFQPPPSNCQVPPPGWYCSRVPGHDGPCAARPL